MDTSRATAFLPSRDAFQFCNAFADEPVLRVGPWRFGRAGNGLCGGMVFAAADYFTAKEPPPDLTAPPASDSPLYRLIVRRLFAAFNLPIGGLRYWRWMVRSDAVVLHRTWRASWPRVQSRIEAGQPCPLGVVTVHGMSPTLLRHNHVVLAYGYQLDGEAVTVQVYDPNTGPSDEVRIELGRTSISSTIDIGHPIRGFFPLRYRARRPTR
ncbi:MAG: hypothetical protein ACR2KJ_08120 [Jatrophihabitans sp.]